MSVTQTLTSLWGRRLGLTASGGLMVRHPTTAPINTRALTVSTLDVVQELIGNFASTITELTVATFKSVVNATETTGTTLVNYGFSLLSSAAATAQFFVMAAPAVGILKMVAVGQNTASEITLQGTATTILFGSTGGDKIFFSAADTRGLAVTLLGITTTRWANIGGLQTGVTITGGA